MINTNRPRRSVLYMPGANTRALEKAKSLSADSLILDLEDAVAPDAKAAARENIYAALESGFGHREAIVRINGLNTQWGMNDLKFFANSKANAILLPKVESAAQIQEAASCHCVPAVSRVSSSRSDSPHGPRGHRYLKRANYRPDANAIPVHGVQ